MKKATKKAAVKKGAKKVAAKKATINKAAAAKAEKTAQVAQGEKKLGKTRQVIVDLMKKGGTLNVVEKNGKITTASVGETKVRNVGVKQLLELGLITEKHRVGGEKADAVTFDLTVKGQQL